VCIYLFGLSARGDAQRLGAAGALSSLAHCFRTLRRTGSARLTLGRPDNSTHMGQQAAHCLPHSCPAWAADCVGLAAAAAAAEVGPSSGLPANRLGSIFSQQAGATKRTMGINKLPAGPFHHAAGINPAHLPGLASGQQLVASG